MFKSDSDAQGGEESGYGGMGSSFSDKAIRLNFIRKVSDDDGGDGGDSGDGGDEGDGGYGGDADFDDDGEGISSNFFDKAIRFNFVRKRRAFDDQHDGGDANVIDDHDMGMRSSFSWQGH